MKSIFLTWQVPHGKSWHLVGKLTYEEDQRLYRFAYTRGTQNSAHFMPFEPMRDVRKMYFSRELFPLFANRLLNKSRPEYSNFLRWLNIEPTIAPNPLLFLARSGGMRATDLLRVFGWPELTRSDGLYEVYFFSGFSQDLRSVWADQTPQLDSLLGQRLRMVHDGRFSLVLEQEETTKMGELPGHLAKLFQRVLNESNSLTTTVVNVNAEAPWQLKVLCKLAFPEKIKVQLCEEEEFQVISSY
ncbi:MAG: hypothetical protein BWK78_01345 [Thiotrichaceae bacterium IS1]|nr:MAG: hypothetical protein BWK78_01345 [Thiotrichaceae bacterium IS1]